MAYSRRVYKREAEAAERAEDITEGTLLTTLETKIFNHKHHRKATTLAGKTKFSVKKKRNDKDSFLKNKLCFSNR